MRYDELDSLFLTSLRCLSERETVVVFVLSPLNQTVDIKMNITYLPLALIQALH